jgi:Transmembrane proteins 230/134
MVEKRNVSAMNKDIELTDPLVSSSSSASSSSASANPSLHRRKLILTYNSPPLKTSIAAVLMLATGSIFLTLSALSAFEPESRHEGGKGIAFLILGLMLFIPGSYSSTVLFGAWRAWPGYTYDLVPSYDD